MDETQKEMLRQAITEMVKFTHIRSTLAQTRSEWFENGQLISLPEAEEKLVEKATALNRLIEQL